MTTKYSALLLLFFCFGSCGVCEDSTTVPELEIIKQSFALKKESIRRSIVEMTAKYRAALERVRDESTKAGKLVDVLAANESLKALEENVVERQQAAKSDTVERLRVIYLKEKEALTKQNAPDLLKAIGAYLEQLDALKVKLTKENRIHDATQVASEQESVKRDTSKPNVVVGSAKQEVRDLVNVEWVYAFAPPRAKPLTFLPDGDIGEGRNPQEAKWEYRQPYLLIFLQTGEVGRAFIYDHGARKWIGTSKTKSILPSEGCYIVRRQPEKK